MESPPGEMGFYLVDNASEWLYRYKVRSPAFVNLSTVPAILPGCLAVDCVAVVGSVDIVLGEVDR